MVISAGGNATGRKSGDRSDDGFAGAGAEVVQSAILGSGMSRVGDSGASLSLAVLSTNKVGPVTLPELSSVKSSTTLLDEMYRQMGTVLAGPSGPGYNLGISGAESSGDLDSVWDLEEYLVELD